MENTSTPLLAVSDFIALTNQTLEYSFSSVAIEGEVASFKVNQNKYVFFDLKDETGSVGCFMTVWQLRTPIEDGMKVIVTAVPKVTDWGKFSLTIKSIRPSGEGSLKKSYELLKAKLDKEGLFAAERKRALPAMPSQIAVISSTGAAGYADFIKILDDRWGGMKITVAQVQVQGKEAPDQIIRALQYFAGSDILPEVIAIVRGGGSADDLSTFNDELLVREIARSRVPVIVGVGHETDVTLADLVADVRAATPSNAAQLLVPDKGEVTRRLHQQILFTAKQLEKGIDDDALAVRQGLHGAVLSIHRRVEEQTNQLSYKKQILKELDPYKVLQRGYAIVRGALETGEIITIETQAKTVTAEVRNVQNNI